LQAFSFLEAVAEAEDSALMAAGAWGTDAATNCLDPLVHDHGQIETLKSPEAKQSRNAGLLRFFIEETPAPLVQKPGRSR